MSDLDRFDRMLLAAETAPRIVESARPATAPQTVCARTPVITSKRGPRYVDYCECPTCHFPKVGVEYHGTLMSGAKVHQVAAHTEGSGANRRGWPRCLGAGMRLVLENGEWKAAAQ